LEADAAAGALRLERQIGAIAALECGEPFSDEFTKWLRDTEVAIERTFGPDSRHTEDFSEIRFSMLSADFLDDARLFRNGLGTARAILGSMVDELKEYGLRRAVIQRPQAEERLPRILDRFHGVARQLRDRHQKRGTLEVEDEYDVQDLLHALLRLDFDDIRSEEWTPSYAGASARMDFLLKQERIVLEVKKTRKGLGPRQIGDELLVDIERYRSHQDCSRLFCFVYDPDGWISNPAAIESDLTRDEPIPVRVIVRPSHH
jgi:hypothetical protein